ncbi:MAG: Ig-like domain-containing protein [Clostridia bacterium]|nr:Ig-like domain-containing protein [Clostridia bacterium]
MIAGVNYDTADGQSDYSKGMTGYIVGIVGYNHGATIINCYSTGLVNFAVSGATFGGIVAKSEYVTYSTLTPAELGFSYSSLYGGANIKDCYTSLSTHMQTGDTNKYAGIVAEVVDHKLDATNNKVTNQMMGLYYDEDKINNEQTGINKDIKVGILKYTIDGSEKVINDTKYVVEGKESSAMKVQSTFVTSSKQTIVYNEEGDFSEVKNVDVPWLFGSVWSMDTNVNEGYPTLNYNLLDLGEDFDATIYATYDSSNSYNVISSGDFDIAFKGYSKDSVITLDKGDKATLVVNPKNVEVTWASANSAIASVDKGEITAVDYGATTITATTKNGKTATISVVVSKVNYVITVPNEILVAYGGYENLNATVNPVKDGFSMWYTIDDTAVALVDDNGKITGRTVGDTTAHIYYGIKDTVGTNHTIYASATTNIKVTCDDYKIVLSSTSLTLEKGSTRVITATVTPNDVVTWSTLNTQVVELTRSGNSATLYAKGVGSTLITATIGKTSVSCAVTVYETPDITYSVSINPDNITLLEAETYGLSYVITASDGSDTSSLQVSWSTSDASIAQVTSNGLVVAGTQGSAVVTAKLVSDNTILDTCNVTVIKATPTPPAIQNAVVSLNPSSMQLYIGEINTTGTITPSASVGGVTVPGLTYSFTSANTGVVNVNSSGVVTPVAEGIASVIVSITSSGYTGSATCYVQVTYIAPSAPSEPDPIIPATGISLNKTSVSMFTNETTTITAVLTNSTISSVTSSKSSLVVTSFSGNTITIKSLNYTGTATITVTNSAGDTATCVVSVSTFGISLSKSSVSIIKGQSATVTATTNPSGYTVSWATNNSGVASISTNGNTVTVVGNAVGTATIAATYNGITAKCTITVSSITYDISLSSNMSINHKASKTLTATITANAGTVDPSLVSWSVNNGNVTLNAYSGVLSVTVYGATVGSSVVTVKIGSYSKSCTVQVNSTWSQYIYTLDQLKSISQKLDETYYLCADINVGSWTPIGTSSSPFTGKLVGQTNPSTNGPYVLSNITVSGKTHAGLFGYTKNASIYNIKISGSSISGEYAGAVMGYMNGGSTYDIDVYNTSVTGSAYAGGVVGYNASGSVYSIAVSGSKEIKLSTSMGNASVGGIAGFSSGTVGSTSSSSRVVTVSGSVTVNGSASNVSINVGGIVGLSSGNIGYARFSASAVKVSGTAKGYVCGIAGNNSGTIKNSYVKTSITGNTSDSSSFTGGIVGRDAGGAKLTISRCGVTSTNITGYYAGGIVGSLSSSQSITMNWSSSNYKKGYHKSEYLSSSTYTVNVREAAVESSVTVTGVYSGGLAGIITNGVIADSYARATVKGYNGSSVKAGFAPVIQSSGMYNTGGTGTAGIVIRCYTACNINSSNGSEHYVTESIVHKYATNNSMRSAGYVIDYLFDKDVCSATAPGFSGWVVNYASKSSNDMKNANTYTSVGFTSTYWSMNNGSYNTLKNVSFPF